ncbi:MAG: hypothetical protein NC344_03385 [Bacteroidales bacterium]|nr:hypothetical protein [Bacteroidales bacterium]MCM1146873.1 hypothetical protein [Bacteroidales bacterium]MCM1205629.1 hypothetical protein [Bacillota bacterium]MCM1510260.1 hypothetical protein [Clostridium sp.]
MNILLRQPYAFRRAFAAVLLGIVASVASADDYLEKGGFTDEEKNSYNYVFLGAVTRLNTGDIDSAMVLLERCREIDPKASATYFFLADCYRQKGQDSLKVVMMRKAAELNPGNITYKEALLPVYLENEEVDSATAVAEEIVRGTPERTDMLQLLLQIYSFQKDNAKCLETLNRLETQEGQSEQLTMSKVQLYTAMGEDKKAYSELKSLADSHPLDLNYRVMMGNWLFGKGRKKEAMDEYRAVLAEEPDNEAAQMSMMDYYGSEGQDTIADFFRDKILLNAKTQQSTRLLLLKQYIRRQEQATTDSTAVLALFDRILETPQTDTQVMELKLAYMTMKQMPEESLKTVLRQILDLRPEHAQARFELIKMAWGKGDHEEMIRLASPALQYNPDEWAFSYFLGVGYFLNDQTEQCVDALVTASEHVDEVKDKELAVEMYELLGDAQHKLGKTKEAFDAYENCLRLDPDKIPCLNNYAYYLSEENRDLDKAAAMSLKTIKAEPNNPIYLDTYAWILYLQGRFEEAKIYIDLAVKNLDETEDNTIYLDHQKEIDKKLSAGAGRK